ncbi:MAG: type I restriction-modification system subunit M N-terminal domain-containing protein, partial [Gemmatimonadota bacterium]
TIQLLPIYVKLFVRHYTRCGAAQGAGYAFYNTSRYDFDKLLDDAPHVAQNLRNYIAGFSPNISEVLKRFDCDNNISQLDEAGLLFQVLERFKDADLHPDRIDDSSSSSTNSGSDRCWYPRVKMVAILRGNVTCLPQ